MSRETESEYRPMYCVVYWDWILEKMIRAQVDNTGLASLQLNPEKITIIKIFRIY